MLPDPLQPTVVPRRAVVAERLIRKSALVMLVAALCAVAFPTALAAAADADADGVEDAVDNCLRAPNPLQRDSDGDQ